MDRLRATAVELPPGGGDFALPKLTVGIFQAPQAGHRLAVGSDRARPVPLARDQGWIMPAGAEGLCLFDEALPLTTVEVADDMLRESGLDPPDEGLARAGTLDPLLVQMVLTAPGLGAGPRLWRESLDMALVLHLAQVLRPAPPAEAKIEDRHLRRALALVEERLGEDISVAEMAAAAAMSEAQFSRASRAATGRSPLQHVIAARMERVRTLLRTTRLPVAEIAWRVGYADPSRFGEHFRRDSGPTPATFRAG